MVIEMCWHYAGTGEGCQQDRGDYDERYQEFLDVAQGLFVASAKPEITGNSWFQSTITSVEGNR
jgi:hypothetical protein